MKKSKNPFLNTLLFLLCLLGLSLAGGQAQSVSAFGENLSAAGTAGATSTFQWRLAVPFSAQNPLQHDRLSSISALKAAGITTTIHASTLTLSGQGSLDQMRTALFNTASPLVDFLSGPVELALYMPAGSAPVTLNLEARTSSGARWEVVGDLDSLYTSTPDYTTQPMYKGFGVPSIQTLQLLPVGSGNTVVHLLYRRPFKPEATNARLTMAFSSAISVIEISNPNPVAPQPEDSAPTAASPQNPGTFPAATSLPGSWDWRTQGIVPPIRDQGDCGSCWAFGTVGAMESALAKAGGGIHDLSEQFLNDCNNDGWNCDGGGETAHKYHFNTLGKNQGQIGAVLESADPYKAKDSTCGVYAHPYKLSGWSYVTTGGEFSLPTVDQIKTAIFTYGPVMASVCASDPAFDNYTGGVYNPPAGTANKYCSGDTDHMIVLVGWDDATQSWILRNSYDTYWGENGYMRIKYDPSYTTSRVGEAASWVTVAGAPGAFSKSSPTNGATVQSNSLTLVWNATSPATYYEYCYATTTGCTNWTNAGNTTSVLIQGLSYSTTYFWQVRAWNGSVGPAYADSGTYWSFTTQTPPSIHWFYLPWIFHK